MIRRMRHYLQEKQLRNIYYAFIKPYLDSGTLTWGSSHYTPCIMDRKIRNNDAQERRDLVKLHYQYLNILTLTLNIKLLQSKFMKKLIKGEQSEPIKTHTPLKYNNSINNY